MNEESFTKYLGDKILYFFSIFFEYVSYIEISLYYLYDILYKIGISKNISILTSIFLGHYTLTYIFTNLPVQYRSNKLKSWNILTYTDLLEEGYEPSLTIPKPAGKWRCLRYGLLNAYYDFFSTIKCMFRLGGNITSFIANIYTISWILIYTSVGYNTFTGMSDIYQNVKN